MRGAAITAGLAVALVAAGCGGGKDDVAPEDIATTTRSAGARTTSTTLALKSQLSAGGRRASSALGSQMVFTGMLFRPKGGSAIGRSQGACTRTAPGRGEVYQCLLSFVLRDGVIYGQSMASADGPAGGVVTGGTDRYHDARGTFRYKATGSARVNLTFKLRG